MSTDVNDGDASRERTCGIIRPIAEMDGYSAQHWSDVGAIVTDTLDAAGFVTRLVSEADDIGVIHGRIVKNLYENDLVVCDVSGRNPNVMFELGMRLAFDKPTIVIKDDATSFSFDTSPIEHIGYPRDLRYSAILSFKEELARKSIATVEAPGRDGYTSFLQHFGPIKVPTIEHQEVSADHFILDELQQIKLAISRVGNTMAHQGIPWPSASPQKSPELIPLHDMDERKIDQAITEIRDIEGVSDALLIGAASGKYIQIEISGKSPIRTSAIRNKARMTVERVRGEQALFD